MGLVLASASPRRAALLREAGYTFTIRPAAVDETPAAGEAPEACVGRLALAKARAVAAGGEPGAIVLGADTVVVVAGGELLGKPAGRADAARMLRQLSGAVHEVFTGVAVVTGLRELVEAVRTRVRLVPLGEAELDWYLASGESAGKAGAYAIQGRAARFIDWIDGSWSNVVGLPLATVARMLRAVGCRD